MRRFISFGRVVLVMLLLAGCSISGSMARTSEPLSGTGGISPSPENEAEAASKTVTPAFRDHRVRAGETALRICGNDLACQKLFLKVNRIDARHVPLGKVVRVPIDMERAARYTPVPRRLQDARGNREIRIYLKEQYFGAYENGALVRWGPVSTGRPGYGTPTGSFRIGYKQRHKRSIKYDNAPMPYSLQFYHGYFMHQQSLPGYPASHGCVRLLESDARELFSWSRIGDPVTIVSSAEASGGTKRR